MHREEAEIRFGIGPADVLAEPVHIKMREWGLHGFLPKRQECDTIMRGRIRLFQSGAHGVQGLIGLIAIRAAGLGQVGTAATALAADGSGGRAHQVDGANTSG